MAMRITIVTSGANMRATCARIATTTTATAIARVASGIVAIATERVIVHAAYARTDHSEKSRQPCCRLFCFFATLGFASLTIR